MDTLTNIWNWVLPIGGGITLGAIIIFIGTLLIKGAFNKITAKLNIDKLQETAILRAIEKIKTISFEQSIQPVVESGLKKVSEEANGRIAEAYGDLRKRYDALLGVVVALSAYFDNSVGVPDETKKALKDAIDKATYPVIEPAIITVASTNEPAEATVEKNSATAPKKSKRNATTVER